MIDNYQCALYIYKLLTIKFWIKRLDYQLKRWANNVYAWVLCYLSWVDDDDDDDESIVLMKIQIHKVSGEKKTHQGVRKLLSSLHQVR